MKNQDQSPIDGLEVNHAQDYRIPRFIHLISRSTKWPIQVQESWDSEFDTLMTTPDVRQEPE